MEENKKKNKILGWILLIILIALILGLNYIKFFANIENEKVVEKESNTESSKVITTALNDIVTNFNESEKIQQNNEKKIKLNAALNQFSIFISYEIEQEEILEGTYEFRYDNLTLSVTVPTEEKNKEVFGIIYDILAEAVQKRLNNTSNISNYINDFINNSKEIEGLTIKENETEKTTTYIMNITTKIGETSDTENNTVATENNNETENQEQTETTE